MMTERGTDLISGSPRPVNRGRRSEQPVRPAWVVGMVLALAVVVSAFAGFVLRQALAGPPLIWNDTRSYRSVADQPLWSGAFWAGHRPPLVPLVMKAVGSSAGFVAVQAVVFVVAWAVLAWTATKPDDEPTAFITSGTSGGRWPAQKAALPRGWSATDR